MTAFAVATGIACTYGSYDGTGSAGSGADGGGVLDGTAEFRSGQTAKYVSKDGSFSIRFSGNAFASATMIRVERLDTRTTEGLTVPRYRVSTEPVLPLDPNGQVYATFYGNDSSGSGEQRNVQLLVTLEKEGVQTPLPLGVRSQNSPRTIGALTRELGIFTLSFFPVTPFFGAPDMCMQQCCANNNTSFPNFATVAPNTSCHCVFGGGGGGGGGGVQVVDDTTVVLCLQNCRDLAKVFSGCDALNADLLSSVDCKPAPDAGVAGGQTCGPNQFCCVQPGPLGSRGPSNPWGCNDQTSSTTQDNNGCGGGLALRCAGDDDCKPDYVCCHEPARSNTFREVARCVKTCPETQRACTSDGQCADGGACVYGPKCSVGRCGSAPPGCTN